MATIEGSTEAISNLKVQYKKLKILHLEDSPSDALLIANALKKGNILYEGLVVDTKQKFINALADFCPDVILSDHSLPSFNSIEALDIFHEAGVKIPFILVTSAMSDEFAADIIRQGADDYILKDRLSRLPIAVRNTLEKFCLNKEKDFFVDELVTKEKRFRALVENSADAVVILNAEGAVTYASPAVKKVLGYSEEEIMRMNVLTIAHPDDVLSFTGVMQQVMVNPGVAIKGHTGQILHKDGSWRWLEATVTNLLHEPAINGIVNNFRDVTERKLAQEEIIKKEHTFRTLIENSVEGMAILSTEGKPLYVSPSIENVLGYTEEEAMHLDLINLAHPEDASLLIDLMGKAMANPGLAVKGEATRMRDKSGSWKWIEGTITNMIHDPAISGIVDNFRDVTERKEAEQIIKDSEEKYHLFFDNSIDGILLTATDGRILGANPAACEMFGMTEEEICNVGRYGLVDAKDPRVAAAVKERINTGKAKAEITLIRRNGERFPGEVTSVVYENTAGEQRTSMIIRDISERKLSEEKIIHLNRLYAFLSEINQTIVHSANEQNVFKEACRIAIEIGKFKAAWIGMIDVANQKVNLIEGFGISPEDLGYFTNVIYDIKGVHAQVLRSETYYMCNNIQRDYLAEQWKPLAAERGYASCIVLPLKKSGIIIGTFNLYAAEQDFFTPQEIALLVEATGDISFALDIFEKQRQKLLADELIKHKESRLNQAQAIAHVGSWELDLSTGVVVWSDEHLRIFGLTPGESKQTYQSWLSFIHPDDLDYVLQMTNETKTTFSNTALFHRIIRKDGTVRHLYSQTRVEFDNEGKPKGLYGAALDVTEIKEAEEALRNSEANLQAIFNNTSEGFILADPNGILKSFNNIAKEHIWLNTGDEISIGKSIYDFVEETRRENYKAIISKVLLGETINYDHFFKRQNGEIKWFHFIITPVKNAGIAEGVCITAADITERKKAEEENRFKANLLNTIGQAAVATDLNGIVNFWNKAAEQIYGWTNEEAIGKNIMELTPSHATKKQAIEIMEELKQGHTWSGEFRVQRKDGTNFPALVTNTPIYDEHQNLTGIIGISSDITEKKKLEDLLDKASHMARIGSYEVDLITNTLYWSDITKEIHEVDETYIPDMNTAINFYKEGYCRETMLKALLESIEKFTAFDLELQIVTAKGNERWVRAIGEPECHDGICTRLYGSFQDIDKMKKAELEVLKVYEEKNTILESIGDCFCAVDKNWNFTYWNKGAEIVLGKKRADVLGKNIWTDIYPETVDTITYINYHKAVAENSVQNFEVINKSINRWLEVSAYPSTNGLSIYFKDITQHKDAEAALTRSEFRYRQIVETAQEGIWLIDENNKTTFVNKRMCEIVGYSKEEMEGKPNYFLSRKEKEDWALERIEKRKQGIIEIYEAEFLTKSGEYIWANVSANPIFDEQGVYRGLLAMIVDITTRKKQEIQIQKNAEERELLIGELTKSLNDLKQFSYITSHNFRAPLTNLVGLLSLLDYNTLDKNNKEIVELFKTSTNQLNKTIDDLVQILIIKNNVNVKITNNNIVGLIDQVCNSLAFDINETNCIISTDLKVKNISFNQFYLESILINLISNAIKYRSPDRTLQVNISTQRSTGGKVTLSISDNGLGVDLHRHRLNIFGLYQRFHSNTDGVGLGLFIVKSQVTALGGNISVESEVDKGTTFHITFDDKIKSIDS